MQGNSKALDNCYLTLWELGDDNQHVLLPKKNFSSKKTLFSEELLAFLYL